MRDEQRGWRADNRVPGEVGTDAWEGVNVSASPFPFGPVKDVHFITLHAFHRFVERTSKAGTVATQMQRMEGMLSRSKEVFLKPSCRVPKLLAHGVQEARYLLTGSLIQGMIFVEVKGVLITAHAANDNEFMYVNHGGWKP